MTEIELNEILKKVVTTENVKLGHTWLRRKLKEALVKHCVETK